MVPATPLGPCEGGFYVLETKNPVHYGAASIALETRHDLLPGILRGLRRVVAHGYAADAVAAEEQGGGVEVRNRSAAAAHQADLPAVTERRDDLLESRTGNGIHHQVYLAGIESAQNRFGQVGIAGVENKAGAQFLQAAPFFGSRWKGESLRDFEPPKLQPVAADLGKVILGLLHKPAFLGAAENFR